MKNFFSTVILITLLCTPNVFAECTTTVAGPVNGATWTMEGSPYCVEGDITAIDLVIEPGVRVEFSGNYVLKVTGVLTAVGTGGSPIIFTKTEGATGWQGILFDHTPSGSQLKYCRIEYSLNSGIRILDSVQTIEDCTLSNNHSVESGGGIVISLTSSSNEMKIKDCTISSNTALQHGGGVYIDSAASLTLENCKITGNKNNSNDSGTYYGGGIFVESAAQGLTLTHCTISDNLSCSIEYRTTYGRGGGIYISKGSVSCNNCMINSNRASASSSGGYNSYSYGGGIFMNQGGVELVNTIVSKNSSTATKGAYGGGIYTSSGTVSLENCTVAYNIKEGINNGNGIVTAKNSVFCDNSGSEITGTAWIDYSLVKGGWSTGEGNIDDNPRFESILNLRIRPDSCCVDAGDSYKMEDLCISPCGPSFGTELNDIGAHGGPGACGWCAYGEGCCSDRLLGDLDGDGDIDAVDLAIFSGNYGRTE